MRDDEPVESDERTALSQSQFANLEAWVRARAGIALRTTRRARLEAHVARRVRQRGCGDFSEYARLIAAEGRDGELGALLDGLANHTTGFFREPAQFEFLRRTLLPTLEQRARAGAPRRLRVWSAACSSGEEPYSVALTLLEHFGRASGWDLRILATDIDARVLESASAGVYERRRLGRVPPEIVERHFQRCGDPGGEQWGVGCDVRALVTFRRHSLMDAAWPARTRFDFVLCRNALMYFDRHARRQLLRRLHGALVDGGHLLVGSAESLYDVPELFQPLGARVYRRLASTRKSA